MKFIVCIYFTLVCKIYSVCLESYRVHALINPFPILTCLPKKSLKKSIFMRFFTVAVPIERRPSIKF